MIRTLRLKEKRSLCLAAVAGVLCLVLFSLTFLPPRSGLLALRAGPPPCVADPSVSQAEQQATKPSEAKAPSIIVYITSWCPACRMTTDYLKEKNVPFTVKDIEKNSDYLKEMVDKVGGYRGVPVVDIDGKIILGFNPYIFDELVK